MDHFDIRNMLPDGPIGYHSGYPIGYLFSILKQAYFLYSRALSADEKNAKFTMRAIQACGLGYPVTILIVSSNPLFKEVIVEAVAHSQTEFVELSPENALNTMDNLKPDVIIIDETITKPSFELLLENARRLQKTRTIVLNPVQNEILLLDSCRKKLRKTDDLVRAISGYQFTALTAKDENGIEMAVDIAKNLSDVINFVASTFSKPPDAQLISTFRVLKINEIPGFNHLLDSNVEILTGVKMMSDYIDRTANLSEQQTAKILNSDWCSLFGPDKSPGQRAPKESLYIGDEIDSEDLLDHLVIEYTQGGLEISNCARRKLDSIETELIFLGSLNGQSAFALEAGNLELAHTLHGQVRSFYNNHLGKWAPEFLSEILPYGQTDYFKGFIHLALGVLARLGDISSINQLP